MRTNNLFGIYTLDLRLIVYHAYQIFKISSFSRQQNSTYNALMRARKVAVTESVDLFPKIRHLPLVLRRYSPGLAIGLKLAAELTVVGSIDPKSIFLAAVTRPLIGNQS